MQESKLLLNYWGYSLHFTSTFAVRLLQMTLEPHAIVQGVTFK